jgi:hypothetical protein
LWDILGNDHIVEEDAPYVVIVDAASGAVLVAILARSCPEISLFIAPVSGWILGVGGPRGTYMIN